MGKTIRQIADEIGVSKQAVWQKIKREPLASALRQFMTRNGNSFTVEAGGIALIKEAFAASRQADVDVNESGNRQAESANDKHVDDLRKQLEAKDKQIEFMMRLMEEREKQVSELTAALEHTTSALHASQALHAGTMQRQLIDDGGTAGEGKKKGIGAFLSRLFKSE